MPDGTWKSPVVSVSASAVTLTVGLAGPDLPPSLPVAATAGRAEEDKSHVMPERPGESRNDPKREVPVKPPVPPPAPDPAEPPPPAGPVVDLPALTNQL